MNDSGHLTSSKHHNEIDEIKESPHSQSEDLEPPVMMI